MSTTTPKSMIGLEAVYIATLASDTEDETTYSAVERIYGAIDVQVAPQNADPDIQYADDNELDRIQPDPEITVTMEMAELPLSVQRKILSHTLDANGVTVKSASDSPPYVAIGIRALKRDKATRRNMWLYKCAAKPISETYHTQEGKTITRQTGKVEFAAIKRTSDGNYMAIADDNTDGFTGGSTFFNTVYDPTPSSVTELNSLTWDLTAPVKSASPDTTFSGTGYSGVVTWTPTATTFAGSTVYKATVVITAASGYVFSPSFRAANIASLPAGSVVTRDGDKVVTVVATYAATSA